MSYRRYFLVIAWLGGLLPGGNIQISGQNGPANAEQIVAKYLEAIGADKFPSITTLIEKGDYAGNLGHFSLPFTPPVEAIDHATFEFYFKAPNLRANFVVQNSNRVVEMHGCNGKVAWYIDAYGRRSEVKPKPGKEYACKEGYEPMPLRVRHPKVRLSLKGGKRVSDHMTWAVRVDDPKSPESETYYFDQQTYLLVRWETGGVGNNYSELGSTYKLERLYSDYRDIGGIKLPFRIVDRVENGPPNVTMLREVAINVPIDAARFEEPTPANSSTNRSAKVESPSTPMANARREVTEHEASASAPTDNSTASPVVRPQPMDAVQTAAYLSAMSFATCPIADLQQTIPELHGLKIAQSQEELPKLLEKIGDKTVNLFQKTPDLIAHEEVLESHAGGKNRRRDFSYLILSHPTANDVTLEEYRTDLQPQTSQATTVNPLSGGASSFWEDLRRNSQQVSARETGSPPLAEGFAYMWVNFYPANRAQSNFRYLGQQKIDRHNTLVVAFSQKPGAVRMPGEVALAGKSVPVYYQGIAWVDESDFRIVRLRTDLLLLPDEVPLSKLTSEMHFADTQVSGIPSLLWLPREVTVTSLISGVTFVDKHGYSDYRLYAAHSRIIINP